MYYKLYTHQRKVHSLIAFPVIFLAIFLVSYFFKNEKQNNNRENQNSLRYLEITNTTHSTATICWRTHNKTLGAAQYAAENGGRLINEYDERDTQTHQNKRLVHCVNLRGLQSDTNYQFRLIIDHEVMDRYFSFKTATQYGLPSARKPVICKVFTPGGEPLSDGVIIVRIKDALPLSALIKPSGECLVPLHYVLKRKDLSLLSVSDDMPIELELVDNLGRVSVVKTTVKYASMLPSFIIGRNYEITAETFDESSNALTEAIKKQSIAQTSLDAPFELFFPRKNAAIAGSRPLIKGRLTPPGSVRILLDNSRSTTTVKVDKEGLWSYTPEFDLSPGRHTVLVESVGSKKISSIKRDFTILKSGLAVLGDATPAATITQIPPTTGIPTPTTGQLPTPTVFVVEATPSPTIPSTLTPTPPITGFNIIPFSFLSAGLIILGVGILFIF